MYKYVIVLLMVAAAVTASGIGNTAMTLRKEGNGGETTGVVNIPTCGGAGKVSQVRISTCSARPCRLNTSSVIEIVFIPSASSTSSALTLTATPIGQETKKETIPQGEIYAGALTTITINGLPADLVSDQLDCKVELFRADSELEICVEDTFNKPSQASSITVSVAALLAFISAIRLC